MVTNRTGRRGRLAGGTAAAGLALAAAVALAAAPPRSTPGSPPAAEQRQARGERVAPRSWERARAVLLLSATRVGQAPDAAGRYWYSRERRAELNLVAEGVPSGSKRRASRERAPSAGPPPTGCEGAALDDGRSATLVHVHTVETWSAVNAGDRSRVVSNQDPEVVFPTPEDKERWRRIGAKELPWPDRPQEADLEPGVRVGDAQRPLTIDEVRALPTTASQLEAELRRLFRARQQELTALFGGPPRSLEFPSFVWTAAGALLPAPTTPGTRAAFFEVLAGQREGIRMVGAVTDPLGRDGVAFAWPNHDPATGQLASESRLIIDPGSGRLLAQDTIWKAGQTIAEACDGAAGRTVAGYRIRAGKEQPMGWVAYEAAGWTDRVGVRP